MQDRYAFDVGDFGKFGLLRHLSYLTGQKERGPLGVLWYATVFPDKGDSGKHLGYLELDNFGAPSPDAAQYRECDPHLYDLFKWHMQEQRTRSIAMLESVVPLPVSTKFYREMTGRGSEARSEWFRRALATVSECSVVFCDPDNGIANPDSSKEESGSVQHVRFQELERLHEQGHGLVVYHHLNRTADHVSQVRDWNNRFMRLSPDAKAVRFGRGNSRAFFVIPSERAPDLVHRLDLLRTSVWVKNRHLEFVE